MGPSGSRSLPSVQGVAQELGLCQWNVLERSWEHGPLAESPPPGAVSTLRRGRASDPLGESSQERY